MLACAMDEPSPNPRLHAGTEPGLKTTSCAHVPTCIMYESPGGGKRKQENIWFVIIIISEYRSGHNKSSDLWAFVFFRLLAGSLHQHTRTFGQHTNNRPASPPPPNFLSPTYPHTIAALCSFPRLRHPLRLAQFSPLPPLKCHPLRRDRTSLLKFDAMQL